MGLYAVIGANFGDEGKGLTTDYLCRKLDHSVVVRFNGGAQAGHTVTTPTGERHVFKHFGSGTFANAPTFLSEHFIVNPLEFLKEYNSLTEFERTGDAITRIKVFIHANAKVTTPYDVMVNWALENKRQFQHQAHGSCGFGIGQTEERHQSIQLSVNELDNSELVNQKLLHIRKYYSDFITKHDLLSFIDESFFDDSIIPMFIDHCRDMLNIAYITDYHRLRAFSNIVFEGAQGLLLDQDHEYFPHVTRSYTGLTNVEDVVKQLHWIDDCTVNVHYISRSYLTRHGNGPLPHEHDGVIYPGIVDDTNFTNHFQGQLRFAPFNFDLLSTAIHDDLAKSTLKVSTVLVITCFNQLPYNLLYVGSDKKLIKTNREEFLDLLLQHNVCDSLIISTSPTAEGFDLTLAHNDNC